jgi:hypothetical protein
LLQGTWGSEAELPRPQDLAYLALQDHEHGNSLLHCHKSLPIFRDIPQSVDAR